MKLKKKYQSISLINFNLLKYQIYNNNTNQLVQSAKIEKITVELKQALKVIYLYNLKNKKILFIGFPYRKGLINQVNHLFISKKLYYKSLGSVNSSMFANYDLVVFNNFKPKDKSIFKSINLPSILFGSCDTDSYGINGFFKNEKSKNFCFF